MLECTVVIHTLETGSFKKERGRSLMNECGVISRTSCPVGGKCTEDYLYAILGIRKHLVYFAKGNRKDKLETEETSSTGSYWEKSGKKGEMGSGC